MPYLVAAICRANEVLAPSSKFQPNVILDASADANSMVDAADALRLFEVLSDEQGSVFRDFLARLPPSLDAAILAAARNALSRHLRVSLVWHPAYDYELELYELSDGDQGMLVVRIGSNYPSELVAT